MGVMHNLYYYNHLMEDIRKALDSGNYASFKRAALDEMSQGEE